MLVLSCWVVAMIAGIAWARVYTGLCTAVTVVAFLWTRSAALTGWPGWVQLAAFTVTPWLLAAHREVRAGELRRLHQDEAVEMGRLAESARALLSLQTSIQQMDAHITEITDLYHVTKETGGTLHVGELFAASLTIAPRLLNATGLRLIDLSGPTPQLFRAVRAADGRMVASQPPDGGGQGTPAPLSAVEQAILTQVLAPARLSSVAAQELTVKDRTGDARVSWAPLLREQRPVGVVVADQLPPEQLKTLSIVANQLSLQLSRIALYRQVEALAVTDALTGLFVRGAFLERAKEELARSRRHGLPCALLMADLDLFKQKNDTFGHLVGDVVLKEVARLLQRNLRDIDLIARFGGEEIILLLVETPVDQALSIAQRLKQLVEVHPIRAYDEQLTQTVSLGVAGFPEHAQSLEALIERADQALYEAKRAGRNRVVRA